MTIQYSSGWSKSKQFVRSLGRFHSNHESARSIREIKRIIKEASGQFTTIMTAIRMGLGVKVLKGIHPDSKKIYHITLKVMNSVYHLNLRKGKYEKEGGKRTYLWLPESLTTVVGGKVCYAD